MTKINQIYKCNICGNIIEVVHPAGGELVCCHEPMQLKEANTEDASQEKHVPFVEKSEKGILIKIGSVEHPMTEDHYIEWIEVMREGGKIVRKNLKPGDKPEMKICCDDYLEIRAYCNLHGLWKLVK